jgi:phosphatidylserine decarboxylase
LVFLAGAYQFFHRDPERFVEQRQNSILSPADGTVFSIEQINFPDLSNQLGIRDMEAGAVKAFWDGHERFWTVSIFMSVLDVHVNRSPVSGTVFTIVHKPGKFRPLFPERKEEHSKNERNTVIIKNDTFAVAVVQVAGHLARKIECWVDSGDSLEQGDRIGWIRMGSRVDLVFPAFEKLAIVAQEGLRVKAGVDALASFNEPPNQPIKSTPRAALKRRNEMRETVLTRLMIWLLYACVYAKRCISVFTNRMRKTPEDPRDSVVK